MRPDSRLRRLIISLAILLAATVYGQQGMEKVNLSMLKGPSGISGAWFMASPPSIPGIQLSFTTAASADLVIAKLVSGEIDGGVLPINVAAKLYNPSITSFRDLHGKEIAIAGQKATPDYLFKYLAAAGGLVEDRDYRPIYSLGYPEIAAQLSTGRLTCAVLPEPFATQALLLDPKLRSPLDLGGLWTRATGLASYPMSLFVIDSALVQRRPDLVKAVSAAYENSIRHTVADPSGTAELAESLDLGIKAAIARLAIPSSNYIYRSAMASRKNIEALLAVFLGFDPKSIGGKLPDDAFYLNPALAR